MVMASYYVLFAVIAPAVHRVLMESAVMTAFVVAAIVIAACRGAVANNRARSGCT